MMIVKNWPILAIAIAISAIGRLVPDESPFWLLMLPGFIAVFVPFFALQTETVFTKILFEVIFWTVNVAFWFGGLYLIQKLFILLQLLFRKLT
jgi:hypothetical protein